MELSEKEGRGGKEAILKMFEEALKNPLETNLKVESVKETENIKKNHMENLELKNAANEMKSLMANAWTRWKKESVNVKIERQKQPNLKNTENRLRRKGRKRKRKEGGKEGKKDRASRICGTLTKYLMLE